jgi:hypothetical protein
MFTILFTIIKKRPDVKDKHDRILERNTRCKRYHIVEDDMKPETRNTVLIAIACAFLSSCSSQEQEWEAVRKTVNGVLVVRNPEEPRFGQLNPELEENLSIGDDRDERFQIFQAHSIALDSGENLYVLDAGNCRVQKFDRNGGYVNTIGRKGQGPGEFVNPSALYIDGHDNLYVSEGRKMHVFDRSGELRKSHVLENNIRDFFVDEDGHIITFCMITDDGGSKKIIVKLDMEGKIIQTFVEYGDVEAVQNETEGRGVMTFKAYHQYNYWPYLQPVNTERFVYAYPSDYRLILANSEGKQLLMIEKDEAPSPITREEKDFIMSGIERRAGQRQIKLTEDVLEAACQFPSHRPFFHLILVDDAGRIYVRSARSVLDRSSGASFDIFDEQGYYLYRMDLPFSPEIIHKGNLYDVSTSEETGYVRIKRYAVKGWDRIKTGT